MTKKYLLKRIEVLKYAIKTTTTLSGKITLQEELNRLLKHKKSL